MPPDRGVFLDTSWRMHPDVCDFVSRTMYDARLASVAGTERQRIDSPGLSGSGLRMLAVDHLDNRGRSIEEAEAIAAQVDRCSLEGTWTDRDGVVRRLTLDDILIVAPYNAQVRCLRSALPDARASAPSTSSRARRRRSSSSRWPTSTGEDVNRGMSFLFSRNRLNVAVSRAQALSRRRVLAAAAERPLQQRRRHAPGQHAVPVRRRGDADHQPG